MLKNIKADKWRHFWVGIPMGGFLQLCAFWLFPQSPITATLAALAVVIAISYGFELFSLFTGLGRYDFYDAVASVIGGVLGMAIAFWVDYEFGILKMVKSL